MTIMTRKLVEIDEAKTPPVIPRASAISNANFGETLPAAIGRFFLNG